MSELGRESANEIDLLKGWLIEFLSNQNPNLGRSGPVCPFVESALNQEMLKIESVEMKPDAELLQTFLLDAKARFINRQQEKDSSNLIFAADMYVLPSYTNESDARIMDEVQSSVKVDFMNEGLMIGQFHPFRNTPGIHSNNFFPHRCPAFCFAIRHMIPSDHVFIAQNLSTEKAKDAASAYLKRYKSAVSEEIVRAIKTIIEK